MIFLRSLAFNLALYAVTIIEMIVFTPFYFLAPRKKAWWVPKFWARSNLWLQKVLAGTKSEITGKENLPDGAYILAPKHQSFWETFALLPHIPDGVYIFKRELMWIPVFGWYLGKLRMIPIDRGSPRSALRKVVGEAQKWAVLGRQILIYPEGTRRPPGAEPAYKHGIAEIYSRLGIPVVPVAHVAGLYWPRRRFLRYPGIIRARFLPPIPPGLSRAAFMARLVEETERACDELLIEAAQSENPPPLPPTAVERLRQLGVHVPDAAASA